MQPYSVFNIYEFDNQNGFVKNLDWLSVPAKVMLFGGRRIDVYRCNLQSKAHKPLTCAEKIVKVALAILLSPLIAVSFAFLLIKLVTCPCIWEKKKVEAVFGQRRQLKDHFENKKYDKALQLLKAHPQFLDASEVELDIQDIVNEGDLKVCGKFINLLQNRSEEVRIFLRSKLTAFCKDPCAHPIDIAELQGFIKDAYLNAHEQLVKDIPSILKLFHLNNYETDKNEYAIEALLVVYMDQLSLACSLFVPGLERLKLLKAASPENVSIFHDHFSSSSSVLGKALSDLKKMIAAAENYLKMVKLRSQLMACFQKEDLKPEEYQKALRSFIGEMEAIYNSSSFHPTLGDSAHLLKTYLSVLSEYLNADPQSVLPIEPFSLPFKPTCDDSAQALLENLDYQNMVDTINLFLPLVSRVREIQIAAFKKGKGQH